MGIQTASGGGVAIGAGVVGAAGGVTAALPPRILNMTVPQVGHLPLMALRPFFMVSSTPLAISFLALHLTQYPSGINSLTAGFMLHSQADSLAEPGERRNFKRRWNGLPRRMGGKLRIGQF